MKATPAPKFFSARKLHACILLIVLTILPAVRAENDPIRILTIGNSFANNITRFFPDLMREGDQPLLLFRANLGGASFERHNNAARAFAENPDNPRGRPYRGPHPVTGEPGPFGLQEILGMVEWDVITVQQVSRQSFLPETFEPHATELLALIRELAPDAEIVVHQVWAYRDDHPIYRNPDFDPDIMHKRMRQTYRDFAARNGLRVLPVGDAFHLARDTERWSFRPDPDFNRDTVEAGQLPNEQSGLLSGFWWRRRDGERSLQYDGFHANPAGEYLGASLLFHFLFPEPETPIPEWTPDMLTEEETASLRNLAVKTLTEQPDD